MSYDTNRLKRWIPDGDGHYSDYAGDLVEAIEEIARLTQRIAELERDVKIALYDGREVDFDD